MERLILATAGAADLIQSVENVSQKEASHFCYKGVANLIELTGRANEHWNVVGLVSLTFSSNQHPRRPITAFQAPPTDCLLPFRGPTFTVPLHLGQERWR